MKTQLCFAAALACALGCSSDGPGEVPVLARPSKSGTIDLTRDDKLVAMVNPEDDSLSVFRADDHTRVAQITTGDEPSAVVLHPDGKTAFVANRAAATVVRVDDIDTAGAAAGTPVPVGSEPTGLALSPTGAKLFVAEWAEGRVSVIDTRTMKVVGTIDSPQNPRALAVTNDLDQDDDDEILVVPEFYGEPVAGHEAKDDGRTGRIRLYDVGTLAPRAPIVLQPIDSGFVPDGSPEGTPTTKTAPNQLASVAIRGGKVYVTSVSASPEKPIRFNSNVQPVVYVGNLADATEDRSSVGTSNLAALVRRDLPSGTRFFLADLVDIAFFGTGESDVAYAVARGADVIQRVVYDESRGVQIGSDRNEQIDVLPGGCKNPIGAVAGHDIPKLFVNCWVSRNLAVVNLGDQVVTQTVESSAAPTGDAVDVNEGRRFYFTGRGRWSKEAWSSCASCHPDGLSDNVTWIFGSGPRQTTSMDGSFSHGPGDQVQRAFNWTAINDEIHDFERNTRDTSEGLGAITSAKAGGTCGNLAEEQRDPENAGLPGQLGDPVKALEDRDINCNKDWGKIEKWVKTIRPPRALRSLDAASVARGAELFSASTSGNNGGCVKCHGGPGWTASRRFFVPQAGDGGINKTLTTTGFTPPALWADTWAVARSQIGAQPASQDTSVAVDMPPAQIACVLRKVGTFGVLGDAAATDALEQRAAPFGAGFLRAQGAGGYNVPSLYGLAVGAPYLHHGQARTLAELLDLWEEHLEAGNPNFAPSAAQKADLVAFLLSIDAQTPEQALPDGFDGCPP